MFAGNRGPFAGNAGPFARTVQAVAAGGAFIASWARQIGTILGGGLR